MIRSFLAAAILVAGMLFTVAVRDAVADIAPCANCAHVVHPVHR